jgi:hypothetical protein
MMEQKMDIFFLLKINPLLSNKFEFAVVGEGLERERGEKN